MVVNNEIFLGSGASLTFVPEVNLYISVDAAGVGSDKTQFRLDSDMRSYYRVVPNLYVGCTATRYNSSHVLQSNHTITSNDISYFNYTPACTIASGDYFVIENYAAPCFGEFKASTDAIRLNADNWLGLIESASFPTLDVEMKQLNLQLGGSRNFTHQYKGISTASGGNINLVANHGAWLYYALGQCTNVNCTFTTTSPANFRTGTTANDVYINTGNAAATAGSTQTGANVTDHTNTGPIFYKTSSSSTKALLPPVLIGTDATGDLEAITRTGTTATTAPNAITYTIKELNTAELPSFSLEQSIAKNPTALTTEQATLESNTFVRVARGNRVNTMTITANENEEIKMTMDLNTSSIDSINQNTTTEKYEARGGETTNTSLFNYPTAGDDELLEPFFFSSGKFTIFGSEFMKITNMTLTINNNLMDKRYIGVGAKDIKIGIPAQRNYELSFTALVTDDKLFEELFTEETTGVTGSSTASQLIELQFDKANSEQILLKFRDYHISSSNWTIPDDKGPITVDATVMPLKLHEDGATVKTHWVLQG